MVSEIIEPYTEHFAELAETVAQIASGRIAKTTDDLEKRALIFLKQQVNVEVMWTEVIGVVLEVLSAKAKVRVSVEEETIR